jgi:hypothetical protein
VRRNALGGHNADDAMSVKSFHQSSEDHSVGNIGDLCEERVSSFREKEGRKKGETDLELIETQHPRLLRNLPCRHNDPILRSRSILTLTLDPVPLLVNIHHELMKMNPPTPVPALVHPSLVLLRQVGVKEVHEETLPAPDAAEEV